MNIPTVRPCASPSPVRSGSWTPRRIPQGPLSKTVEKHAFLRWRLWNSNGSHCAQDADLTNSIKILLIHRNPLKPRENGHFRVMVPAAIFRSFETFRKAMSDTLDHQLKTTLRLPGKR